MCAFLLFSSSQLPSHSLASWFFSSPLLIAFFSPPLLIAFFSPSLFMSSHSSNITLRLEMLKKKQSLSLCNGRLGWYRRNLTFFQAGLSPFAPAPSFSAHWPGCRGKPSGNGMASLKPPCQPWSCACCLLQSEQGLQMYWFRYVAASHRSFS